MKSDVFPPSLPPFLLYFFPPFLGTRRDPTFFFFVGSPRAKLSSLPPLHSSFCSEFFEVLLFSLYLRLIKRKSSAPPSSFFFSRDIFDVPPAPPLTGISLAPARFSFFLRTRCILFFRPIPFCLFRHNVGRYVSP